MQFHAFIYYLLMHNCFWKLIKYYKVMKTVCVDGLDKLTLINKLCLTCLQLEAPLCSDSFW